MILGESWIITLEHVYLTVKVDSCIHCYFCASCAIFRQYYRLSCDVFQEWDMNLKNKSLVIIYLSKPVKDSFFFSFWEMSHWFCTSGLAMTFLFTSNKLYLKHLFNNYEPSLLRNRHFNWKYWYLMLKKYCEDQKDQYMCITVWYTIICILSLLTQLLLNWKVMYLMSYLFKVLHEFNRKSMLLFLICFHQFDY